MKRRRRRGRRRISRCGGEQNPYNGSGSRRIEGGRREERSGVGRGEEIMK